MLPNLTTSSGVPISGTDYVARNLGSQFIAGNVSNIFDAMDGLRAKQALATFDNRQVLVLFMRSHFGYSNYNALVATLRKHTANGLSFDVNYTWSHGLDDGVSNQDSAGFFPNSYYPGLNYGASLFDRRQVLNTTTVWDLPLGKGHRLSFSGWSDKLLDNWYGSAIFTAETGLPVAVVESSQVYGGGAILSGATDAIPTASVSSFGAGVHRGVGRGTGLNLFANPGAVLSDFRPVNLSTDGLTGRANPITGLPFVNLDMSVGKRTQITEGTALTFSVDAFNALNNVNFATPTLNLFSLPSAFGNITNQFVPANRTAGSRWIELGLRFDF